jgi:hypothetical protein
MNDVKYKDYRIGKYLFTVRFQRRYDLGIPAVDVEVLEHHTPRTGFIHRLIDFFKYNRYWSGCYFVKNGETLDEYAIRCCNYVVNLFEEKIAAEKFWEDLDK